MIDKMLKKPIPTYKRFPCVTPSWDNTARRKNKGFIIENSSPDLYEKWLTTVIKSTKNTCEENNFVFINAWNEWAEGNHLEPCQKWGHTYLEATRRALKNTY
jgi:lipopolysaccharide biosynthesis protein